MKNKKIIVAIVVVCLLVLVTSVYVYFTLFKDDNKNVNDNNSVNNIIEKEELDEEIVPKKVEIIDVDSKSRPYAVMINTHNAALPQSGLDNAYIVYELMVEGGITRMMALFKDREVSKIGSVRSARCQYLDYVYENDAIYAHAGGAEDALRRIANEGINDVDVDGEYGVRDRNLNRAWEHTLFTTTSLLNSAVNNRGMRKITDNTSLLKYSTEEVDLSSYSDSKMANSISIKYSDYRTTNYKYDSENKVYLRYLNDTPNNDLVTGIQYKVKNILVYGVNYTTYSDHGYWGYQKIDNVGEGRGYYITNGYSIPIIWKKNSHNEKTQYINAITNEELILNDGNTYIQIYPSNQNLTIS